MTLFQLHLNVVPTSDARWDISIMEGFPGRVLPKALKLVAVYSSVTFHIKQQQVGPVSVYCDREGCHVLCMRHGIPVWQHIGQSTTTTSRYHRDMTSDV